MEAEDMISLPYSVNSGESGQSTELNKPDFGSDEPSDSRLPEDALMNGENLGIHEVETGTTAPETDDCTKGSKDSELIEGNSEAGDGSMPRDNLRESLVDSVTEEGAIDDDNLVLNRDDVTNEDNQFQVETEVDMDLVDSPVRQVNIEVSGTVRNLGSFGFSLDAQNDEGPIHNHITNRGPVSGVKRARITYDEQQPSVHVTYNSLKRASKRKLEELLQQWSEWHVQHGSSSQDSSEVLESGEETYFPALCVGTEKSSAVSFWIENQTKKQQSDDFIASESDSVPLYDRGFSLGLTSTDGPSNAEGGLEIVDEAARCFNCGSYNHSLKDCPKPRDNAAVNSARKQHKSKRNQNAGSRNATRYYQNSSGGKYDGLKPGSLDAETRRLLGLGELDPPPWLNRMRELGYPPGYLDPDDEDQPSGIMIFADGEVKDDQEDGEIVETEKPEPPMKETVEFPGINAPIPDSADEQLWAAGPSSSDSFRNRPLRKINYWSESISRWHHHEQRGHRDSNDEGPPGVDPVFSPSSYPPRYGNYDTPSLARSHSERGRRSPLVYEDFADHSSSPYSSSSKRHGNGSARLETETDERWNNSRMDYSQRSSDDYDRYENDQYDRYRHRRR